MVEESTSDALRYIFFVTRCVPFHLPDFGTRSVPFHENSNVTRFVTVPFQLLFPRCSFHFVPVARDPFHITEQGDGQGGAGLLTPW